MNEETQPNGNDIDVELKALIAEQEGDIANKAADASLQVLGLLGAITGPVTPAYRMEVAKSLVTVLLALASVRYCIEAATETMNDFERMSFLSRLVGIAFGINPEPVIDELLKESVESL